MIKLKKDLFEILSEGKPNSLGRVIEVYDEIVNGNVPIIDLYELYFFKDSSVSMRVSNIIKRLWRKNHDYLIEAIDWFIRDANELTNPTFRWTIAQIYKELYDHLSSVQKEQCMNIIVHNLEISNDWILLTQSMDAIIFALRKGKEVHIPQSVLNTLEKDDRKVVKNKYLNLAKLIKN